MNKTLRRILLAGTIALAVAGCVKPTINMKTEDEITNLETKTRYSVKRVAVFSDNLAYENRRGIYEITDKKTGKTYLGVSGIGITELGSHSTGKASVEDER